MDLPALTHRQIALFRAIMLHGNLGRAADATGSSQPTLSRELARLEQLLGYALFDRVSGRLRPTARALALMQEVERSFVGLEHIARQALALRTAAFAPLRLACLPALAHALVPRALVPLTALHPELAVQVHPLESPWLEEAVAAQRCDCALGETRNAPTGTERHLLLRTSEVAVLPASHSLCRKRVLTPEDFAQEAFISLAADDPYRQAIDALFAEHGVVRRTTLETASAVAACAMVRHGLGLTIVNPLTALELAGPDLAVRALSVAIPFEVSLLLPTLAAPHPQREALVQALTQAGAALTRALSQQHTNAT